jgi:excisionase family DNA binding protein
VDRYLSVAEAANLIGVGTQTMYRLVWSEQITWNNVGQGRERARIRIPESALRAYMKSRERPAAA